MLHNRPLIYDFDADYRGAVHPFSGLDECTIEHAEELAARIEQIMDDIESLQGGEMSACDGCGEVRGEVRRLPTGGDSAAIIVCHNCYRREIAFRVTRNRELTPDCQFDLPRWAELRVIK